MLYIAYIGAKGTKEKKGMNVTICVMKGKQKVPIKRKTYIYTYIGKKKKRVQKGTKKRD